MKNQKELLKLYLFNTGKKEHTPKKENDNPAGYQVSRVKTISRYGMGS